MPAPSSQEYATASAAAYNIASGGFAPPTGWKVLLTSSSSQQSSGFAAVALKDPSGNVIITNEGTVPGLTSFDLGTLGADLKIMNGQSPQAFVDAQSFAQQVLAAAGGSPIYVTGHSLGGGDAEAECQILGSSCAGGATFGAPGLPGNSASGPSSLTNYVDYGDPIGNFASDASSPLSRIVSGADSSMLHYGSVVYTGSAANAVPLQNAANDVLTAASSSDTGAYYGEGTSAGLVLAGYSSALGNLDNHYLSKYGTDLGLSVSAPAAANTPDPTLESEGLIFFGLPMGGVGKANDGSAAVTSSDGVSSPDANITLNTTTDQSSITQTKALTLTDGAVQSAGTAELRGDLSNGTAVVVAGPNATTSTTTLSGNVLTVTTTSDFVTATPGTSTSITGSSNSLNLLGKGDAATLLSGTGETVTGSGDSITLGSANSNSTATISGSNDAITVNGGIFYAWSTATVNGNSNVVTAGFGARETLNGTGDTVNGSYTYATLDAHSAATFNGTSVSVTDVGSGDSQTINGPGTTVPSPDDVYGSGETVNVDSGTTVDVSGNSNSIVNNGSGCNDYLYGSTGDKLSGVGVTVELVGGSNGVVDGSSNTINLEWNGEDVLVGGNADHVIGGSGDTGDIIDVAAGETVTISGSGETVVGDGHDTINVTGTGDHIYADSSTIDISGSDTGDIIYGSGDTGDTSDWGGYVSQGGSYGGYGGGGYYASVARRKRAAAGVSASTIGSSALKASQGVGIDALAAYDEMKGSHFVRAAYMGRMARPVAFRATEQMGLTSAPAVIATSLAGAHQLIHAMSIWPQAEAGAMSNPLRTPLHFGSENLLVEPRLLETREHFAAAHR